jgi:cytochrome c oxidase subunit 4
MAEVHVGPPGNSAYNNLIAMTIACAKAGLVVGFFMHVKFSSQLIKFWAILGFVWFLLMFITFGDYATRKQEHIQGWEKESSAPHASEPAKNSVEH